MIHTIENDLLICEIVSKGAEVRSLKSKTTGAEYIWQIDPTVWNSSSPVLFPAIGNIKNKNIVYNGNDYAMPKHGIVRYNENLHFQQIDPTSCSFTLASSDETLQQYPFAFQFKTLFSLVEQRLQQTYHISNTGATPMYFACGGHTAYACPLSKNIRLSDYVIEFPKPQKLLSNTLGPSGLLLPHKRPIQSYQGILPLSDTLFEQDALIFTDTNCDWIRLRKKEMTKGVVVRFPDYPHLALWSKPAADFVCIEPWLGLPDSIDTPTDITKKPTYKILQPDTSFSISIETQIES